MQCLSTSICTSQHAHHLPRRRRAIGATGLLLGLLREAPAATPRARTPLGGTDSAASDKSSSSTPRATATKRRDSSPFTGSPLTGSPQLMPTMPSPPPSIRVLEPERKSSSAELVRLLAAEAAGSVEMVHNTRAEQLDEIAALLGALEDGNSLSIKPSARLAACVLLLRGVVFEGPDTPEQPKPTGSCTPTSSCAESEVGSSSGVSPPGPPPPHDELSWEHTSGANAQADGAVLKRTPPPTPAPPVVKSGSGSSSEPQQPAPLQQPPATVRGCCGRGRWQQGEGHGIVSFTFRIVRSKLGDGGRIKLGIVAQGADGSMQEALVFNPRSGNFTEMPHDLPDLTNGILGECLMPGNLAGNRATGALVEVQANTLKNELRFRVADNKGHRHPWHTAIIRRKAVALPAVFAPFCRLGKPGDAVELVRCHVYIPGEAIREQLALPPLGVQLNELDKALSMPDPSASPADLSAGKLKLDEARAVQSMATEGSGCPLSFSMRMRCATRRPERSRESSTCRHASCRIKSYSGASRSGCIPRR